MENNWFKNPGNIEEQSENNISYTPYFKQAGDLDHEYLNNSGSVATASDIMVKDAKKVQEWLNTISSGKRKYNGDFGSAIPSSGGQIFVTLEKLNEMINNGDNIISAKYYENMNMVLVEFESFNLNSSHKRR